MRTFAQKPKVTQHTKSSKSKNPGWALSGKGHDARPFLHLQLMIGNQAVQRLLQTNTKEFEVGSATTSSSRFAHDFSQIPVHPKVRNKIQPKLTFSTPGEENGHEAYRVSPHGMNIPEPKLQHAVDKVVSSAGRPLKRATRAFFEPRLGHDLKKVRVHTDTQASVSARAMNALSYTVGSHIVFGAGQYAPGTENGRWLLGHELAHVVQQNGEAPIIGTLRELAHNDKGETEARQAAESMSNGLLAEIRMQTEPCIAREEARHLPSKKDPVTRIVINLTSKKIVFFTSSGQNIKGTVWTDLEPGIYTKVTTHKDRKKWKIPNTDPGLRFDVELDVDPWALPYAKWITVEVKEGGKEDVPLGTILRLDEILPIEGDPSKNPKFLQNAVERVWIPIWGGPFYLYLKGAKDPIVLPRAMVAIEKDPLAGASGTLNHVYKTREVADAVIKDIGRNDLYTYYYGTGGLIFPTIISDTSAPYLVAALRQIAAQERKDAAAAANLGVNLALWYVGARFPIKASEPAPPGSLPKGTAASAPKVGAAEAATPATAAASGAKAVAGGGESFTVVEIGAGNLKASIELAKKGGVRVVAVDPVAPAAEAVAELQSLGGTFVKGTAETLEAGSAHHVFQYFPWRIGGAGRTVTGGTWRLIQDTVRVLKPNGAAHFVTEDLATAEFLAKEASSRGLRTVITETTAGAAAPGASGAGVPSFSAATKVWMVNIYK